MDEFGKLVHTIKSRHIGFYPTASHGLKQTQYMFTEFGGGMRAPFPNSGWKSSLTEDSGWFDLSTICPISKTRLTLTPSNQCTVRDMETSPNHLLNCFQVLFSRKTLLLNIT